MWVVGVAVVEIYVYMFSYSDLNWAMVAMMIVVEAYSHTLHVHCT